MMALKHDMMIGYAATTGSVNILAPWGGYVSPHYGFAICEQQTRQSWRYHIHQISLKLGPSADQTYQKVLGLADIRRRWLDITETITF